MEQAALDALPFIGSDAGYKKGDEMGCPSQ
jgi:hypothetical protein